uniref:FAF domain-containing protein n=1 Tax=Oryza barthii TaxID=65489 RepID=A0A0D3HV84_9ORYZ
MCSEVLGFESGGSHVTMDILPHEVSELESNLLDIHEKRRLAKESRPPLPPAMPWRGKRIVLDRYDGRLIMSQVPIKLPFTLHASRVDGRLRLSCMHPSDSVDELKVASNGKKDAEDHAKGNHGEKNVEYISSKAKVGEGNNLTGCRRSSGNGAARRVCMGMKLHVTMDILPHEVSELESNLLDIHEKGRLAKESQLPLPPAMPWRGKCIVPTKLPFTLHASRVDGRLRLCCMHPSDSVDELKVASNGKKDVEDHAKGNHGTLHTALNCNYPKSINFERKCESFFTHWILTNLVKIIVGYYINSTTCTFLYN